MFVFEEYPEKTCAAGLRFKLTVLKKEYLPNHFLILANNIFTSAEIKVVLLR